MCVCVCVCVHFTAWCPLTFISAETTKLMHTNGRKNKEWRKKGPVGQCTGTKHPL